MMANDAYWAIVIIDSVFVVMGHCHECGSEKEKYKKNNKTFDPAHGVPFRDDHRLIIDNDFVKICLQKLPFQFQQFKMYY